MASIWTNGIVWVNLFSTIGHNIGTVSTNFRWVTACNANCISFGYLDDRSLIKLFTKRYPMSRQQQFIKDAKVRYATFLSTRVADCSKKVTTCLDEFTINSLNEELHAHSKWQQKQTPIRNFRFCDKEVDSKSWCTWWKNFLTRWFFSIILMSSADNLERNSAKSNTGTICFLVTASTAMLKDFSIISDIFADNLADLNWW